MSSTARLVICVQGVFFIPELYQGNNPNFSTFTIEEVYPQNVDNFVFFQGNNPNFSTFTIEEVYLIP